MQIQSLVSEVKLTYTSKVKPSQRPYIKSSRDSEDILRPYFQHFIEHREGFYVMVLNRSNRLLAVNLISLGGVSGTTVDIKLIFQTALLCNGSGIILAHNHPSGNLRPSSADLSLTRKIGEAGKLLDIQVFDHLILTADDYTSLADSGMM